MKKYGLIVYNPATISDSIRSLKLNFKLTHCQSIDSLLTHAFFNKDHLILIDVLADVAQQFELLHKLKNELSGNLENLSIAMLIDNLSLDERLKACELGADDCISNRIDHADLVTRLQSTVYNAIANKQLKEKLKTVSDAALAAVSNTSDMGTNIQFLLDSYQCENLDQLGQLLFKGLNYYGLSCSLQMRSKYLVKNMEANGMERTMESKLLSELKGAGCFYDFGSRTVMNCGAVSVLVKNMPIGEPDKNKAVKDNVFTLLQGADAKIKSIDSVLEEKERQQAFIKSLESGIKFLDNKYIDMTNKVAKQVDELVDSIETTMQTLLLTEEQEKIVLDQIHLVRDNVIALFEDSSSFDDELKGLLTGH